jgi:hypothetical protein
VGRVGSGEIARLEGRSSGRGATRAGQEVPSMLWTIIVILVVLWLLGLATNIVGGLIHALLVIALIVLVYQLLTGRRTV